MNEEFEFIPSLALAELQEALATGLGMALSQRSDLLPGLMEFLSDHVVFHLSLDGRDRLLGSFCANSLRIQGRAVCEIRIAIKEIVRLTEAPRRAEQMLVTAIHEAAHAWAFLEGIKDTSRDGRYHNRRFGETAVCLGLSVAHVPSVGVTTIGLQPIARMEFADALDQITSALVIELPSRSLTAEPQAGTAVSPAGELGKPGGGTSALPKHVTATCDCVDPLGRSRRLRMAAGSWRLGPVICGVCGAPFTSPLDGPLSTGPRRLASPANPDLPRAGYPTS